VREKASARKLRKADVAINPCFRELRLDRALPAWVLGPVLFFAFVLLASSWLFDAIIRSPLGVSIGNLTYGVPLLLMAQPSIHARPGAGCDWRCNN